MAVQWLRPHAFTAEDMKLSPGRGTRALYAAWHCRKKEIRKD